MRQTNKGSNKYDKKGKSGSSENDNKKPFNKSYKKDENSDKKKFFKKDDDSSKRKSYSKDDDSSKRKPFSKDDNFSKRKPFVKDENSSTKKTFEKDENYSTKKPFEKDENSTVRKPYAKDKESIKQRFIRREAKFAEKRNLSSDENPEKKKFNKRDDSRDEGKYVRNENPEKKKSVRKNSSDKKSLDSNDSSFKKNNIYLSKDKNKTFDKKPQPKKPTSKNDDGSIRINKYIANSGVCSRREADEMINQGLVEVNGNTITEPGYKVLPGDVVKVNNSKIKQEKPVYVLMNKPKDTLTAVTDDRGRKTVIDIIGKEVKERIFPVGRLDRNTTGVLLLTNDGDLAKKLAHPKYNKKKIYHVYLDKKIIKEDMYKLTEGIELEDGLMTFDKINFVSLDTKTEVGVEIHSGKNRIVRRMFESLDYKVIKLDRVYFAGLTKKGLGRGFWRYLTEKEIQTLKSGSYE